MLPLRTVYVPRFGSQQSSSQTDEAQTDHTGRQPRPRPKKRGNKRARGHEARPVLKVKLPKLCRSTSSKTADASVGWIETAARETHGASNKAEIQNSQSEDGSVYFFSEPPNKEATSEKEKAKLSVLKTISKMLEENQLIRQRLAVLCSAHGL